jgi:hypothetical protein
MNTITIKDLLIIRLCILKAFIFFATHFHELTRSLTVYPNVVNLHLEVEVSFSIFILNFILYLLVLYDRLKKKIVELQ